MGNISVLTMYQEYLNINSPQSLLSKSENKPGYERSSPITQNTKSSCRTPRTELHSLEVSCGHAMIIFCLLVEDKTLYPTGPRTGENAAGGSPCPRREPARNGASRRRLQPLLGSPCSRVPPGPDSPHVPSERPGSPAAAAASFPSGRSAPLIAAVPGALRQGRAGHGRAEEGMAGQSRARQGRPSPRQAGPAALTERAGPAPPGPRPAAAAP